MIDAALRLGVVTRPDDPHSIRGYRRCVLEQLGLAPQEGTRVVDVDVDGRVPGVSDIDVLWDPGLGMRRIPSILLDTEVPVVATVHGLRAFTLPLAEAAGGFLDRARTRATMARVRRGWKRLRDRVAAVICVSRFGADEAIHALGLSAERVTAIYHGVDHSTFSPAGAVARRAQPFFLMVTQYQPKKNVERALEAHASLLASHSHEFVLVAPGFPDRVVPPGVTVVREALAPSELAELYRGALGYLCPSLHETFGMPLLEAMACGCPVVTSNVTACPEVTGDAALHVDPRDARAIEGAMVRLLTEESLRDELRQRGIARASDFTWQRSMQEHLEVFRGAVGAVR